MTPSLYHNLLLAWIAVALVTFIANLKITAPYGRHTNTHWGSLMINNRLAWILMELPALVVMPLLAILGPSEKTIAFWILVGMWLFHYINRTIIYPLRIRTKGKKMPLSVALMAVVFNLVNGWFVGVWLGSYGAGYPDSWLSHPAFIIGILIFFIGFAINVRADHILVNLRKPGNGNGGYKIPFGFLFRWISCPNHFGEIIAWIGFAMATGSWAGASFAIWTAANLIPRALSHHRWYREHFAEYPPERRAVLPGLL